MAEKRDSQGRTVTYNRWRSMIQRCTMPKQQNYSRYGGAGVTVCERWRDFKNFLADMGRCPDETMSLDRIDNTRGYEPENCRWLPLERQSANRRCCVLLTHNGETHTLADWERIKGVTKDLFKLRHRRGWSADEILSIPAQIPGGDRSQYVSRKSLRQEKQRA